MFTGLGEELFTCTCTKLSMIIRTTCGICFTCELWHLVLNCGQFESNIHLPTWIKPAYLITCIKASVFFFHLFQKNETQHFQSVSVTWLEVFSFEFYQYANLSSSLNHKIFSDISGLLSLFILIFWIQIIFHMHKSNICIKATL